MRRPPRVFLCLVSALGHGVVVPGRMQTPLFLAVRPQTLVLSQRGSRPAVLRSREAASVRQVVRTS